MNLKATQNPVNTEHSATSLACGWRPSPLPLRGFPKNRTTAGVLGRSTSAPSMASSRKVSFQSMAGANVASNRRTKCPQRVRQNPMVSCFLAWQKASSLTQPWCSHGHTARTNPHAWASPWVIEVVCKPTYIINQATTSGMSGRWRLGAQSASRAAVTKTSGDRIPRKGANPNCWRMTEAHRRCEPIPATKEPPCIVRGVDDHGV